mgnify:CR=1 FL=1
MSRKAKLELLLSEEAANTIETLTKGRGHEEHSETITEALAILNKAVNKSNAIGGAQVYLCVKVGDRFIAGERVFSEAEENE